MHAFVMAYAVVLLAELVGDRIFYSLGALATSFRPGPILFGAGVAFSLKMLAAVLFGRFVGELPPVVVSALSAVTFLTMAIAFLLKKPSVPPDVPVLFSRAALASFAVVFLSEWGDPGQLSAALLVARGERPVLVWCGAVSAMLTKAAIGLTLGMGLRRFLPQRIARMTAFAACATMGVLSVGGVIFARNLGF